MFAKLVSRGEPCYVAGVRGHVDGRIGDRAAVWIGLAWAVAVVGLPVWLLVEQALPLELSGVEQVAIWRALGRGAWLSAVVATFGCGLGLLLARTVAPVALLALLLISRSMVAHGVLALGLEPGPPAAALALILDVAPFAGLLAWLRLRARPRELLDAAADLGAGRWVRIREIEWPHLRPAMLAAWLWSFLQAMGDVVGFELAGGGHAYTPGLLIRDALIREQAPGRALVAVLIVVGLSLPCAWAIGRELAGALRDGGAGRGQPASSRGLRVAGALTLAGILAGPALVLLGPQSELGVADRQLAELALRSLGIAGLVAAIASAVGLGLALAGRRGGRRTEWIAAAVLAPVAIPPAVLGMLILGVGARVGIEPGPTLTVLALLGPGLALGYVAARLSTAVIPEALIDLARDLGARPLQRLRLVWLPLALPALAVALVVVAAWVLGQAAIPSFTSGPGGDTLAVALTIHARAGELELVRRWSLVLVLAPVLAAVLTLALARRLRRTT